MRKRLVFWWILGGFAYACGDAPSPQTPPSEKIQTVLGGQLYWALADHPRRVQVLDHQVDQPASVLCETESDGEGRWSCGAGPVSGTVQVTVDLGAGEAPLRALVDGVELGKTDLGVQVSPVTELVASLAEHLESRGFRREAAVAKARTLIQGHFGGLAAARLAPAPLEPTLSRVTDASVLSALLVGFEALAHDFSVASNQPPEGPLQVWSLLRALSADISADGVFDGKAKTGALRLGMVDLDGDTLRAEYGRAILDWLGSERNSTALKPSDFEALAHALASNTSEIFPQVTPDPLDDDGPTIDLFRLHKDDLEIAPGDPVSGDFGVELGASDAESPLASLALLLLDASAEHVEVLGEGADYRAFRVHTAGLADGSHRLQATARDVVGNQTQREVEIVVDNTAPVVTATAAGIVQSGTVRVRGTVEDAIGPVDRIELALGETAVVVESPGATWESMIEVPCDADWTLDVRAFDRAGNVATTRVQVRCDASPPTLGWEESLFAQESSLDAIYSADGRQVTYAWAASGGETVALNGQTDWANLVLTKYFNRLDETSENLPVLRFRARDGEGGVRVDYRYLINGEERRAWTTLPPAAVEPAGNAYALSLSYQSLDAALGRSLRADVHRVEVRAVDDAGHEQALAAEFHIELRSPPLWFGQCQVGPSLERYTLADRTLHTLYQQNAVDVMVGAVRYGVDLGGSSLAPSEPVIVQFTPGEVLSRITELGEDRHDGPEFMPNGDFASWCVVNAFHPKHKIGRTEAERRLFPCEEPLYPADTVSWRADIDESVNDLRPHIVTVAVNRGGQSLSVLPNGEFRVLAGVPHGMGLEIQDPRLFLDGAQYDWSENFTVPQGYTASASPPRYRVPDGAEIWNRVGINFEQVTRNGFATTRGTSFVTRAYIHGFAIEVPPVVLTARHESLPEVSIPIQAAPECAAAVVYTTTL